MSEQTNEQPSELIIPISLAGAIVQYLARRPYIEVQEMIAAMQKLQPVERQEMPAKSE